MPAVLRLTRLRAAALIIVTLAVVSAAVAARRSSAATPDARYTEALVAEAQATGVYVQGMLSPYVRTVQGVTATPDNRGAFVVYDVNAPAGTLREAIYALTYTSSASRALSRVAGESVPAGTIRARTVSFRVYSSWSAAGAERGYGYPITSLRDVTSRDLVAGCRSGDRAQWFHRVSLFGETRVACVAGPHPAVTGPGPLPAPVVRWIRA